MRGIPGTPGTPGIPGARGAFGTLGLPGLGLFALLALSQCAAEVQRAPTLAPCEWQGITVECGTVDVPERADAAGGRTLSIFFVIVRATEEAVDDPVFYFSGGPGTAASRSARGLAAEHAGLRRTRDFVFIDQRGTGRSAPLACDTPPGPARLLEPIFDRAETAACRAALERSADLRHYTTADAARDVDAVRRALGYARINLIGTSYGTRAAWTYAAMFPAHARTLLLVGPVPPGFYVPAPFARGLDVALEGVLAACEADPACRERYPSLRRDTARAFDRLRAAPAPVRVIEPGQPGRPGESGKSTEPGKPGGGGDPRAVDATITYGEFAESVRYLLYTPGRAAGLPMILTDAASGDYTRLLDAVLANRRNLQRAIAQGMYLSVTCAEDIPFITGEMARASSAGTRLGDYRVRQQMEACAEWPRGEAPPPATSRPLESPALVEAGAFDPATPLADAKAAMRLLPNGRLVVVPHGGHGFTSLGIDACIVDIERRFIESGTATDLDTSCVAAAKRPPFTVR